MSFEGDLVRNVRAALQLLWGGVLFVLLIAAVNITNLSLDLRPITTQQSVDSQWAAQVTRHTISRIRAVIP